MSQDLSIVREHINALDHLIFNLLGDRAKLVELIAEIKSQKNIPIRDSTRENAHRTEMVAYGNSLGLSPMESGLIISAIMQAFVQRQEQLRGIPRVAKIQKYFCEPCEWNTCGLDSPNDPSIRMCPKCQGPLYLPGR